jgi:nucleoid DNA-binding protein
MDDPLSVLDESTRAHLSGLLDSSGLPQTKETLQVLAGIWLEKKRLFEEQIRALDMLEVIDLPASDPRGALLLTSSASLVSVGPLEPEGRRLEYASIQLRTDVPHLLSVDNAGLQGDLAVGREARFTASPLQTTSQLLKIAVCDPAVGSEEQAKRLREATIFLTNRFVKINRTATVPGADTPAQFHTHNLVTFLARRNGLSQKQTRRILDDYHLLLESGLLLGERVRLGRIGTLTLRKLPARKARVGVNPATGQPLTISARPETSAPRLAFSRQLKERARQVP